MRRGVAGSETGTRPAIFQRLCVVGRGRDAIRPAAGRQCETAAVACTAERARGRQQPPALSGAGARGGGMACTRAKPEPCSLSRADGGGRCVRCSTRPTKARAPGPFQAQSTGQGPATSAFLLR